MLTKLSAALAAICVLSGASLAQEGAKPADPQIAHIAYTAGEIDIKAAKQALAKSRNNEDNDTSRSLLKQADEKYSELAMLRRAAFDRAYANNEVAYHKTVDGALENTLIPSASNPELKSLLETGLKIFQGHEQHAEHVAADLKAAQTSRR